MPGYKKCFLLLNKVQRSAFICLLIFASVFYFLFLKETLLLQWEIT